MATFIILSRERGGGEQSQRKEIVESGSMQLTFAKEDSSQVISVSGIPRKDIVRGFWFYYPYVPSPGKRFWLQIDKNTWVEAYANGSETRFRVIGRDLVKTTKGTLLLKIEGNPKLTLVPDNGTFQVFVPDKGSRLTDALFRNLIKGGWQDWQTLGAMDVLR